MIFFVDFIVLLGEGGEMSWRNECVQYVILLKSGQIVFHLTGQDKIQKVILLMERSFISVVMKFLPLPHSTVCANCRPFRQTIGGGRRREQFGGMNVFNIASYRKADRSVHPFCPSICLSVCLSVCPSVCPSVLPSVHLSNNNGS